MEDSSSGGPQRAVEIDVVRNTSTGEYRVIMNMHLTTATSVLDDLERSATSPYARTVAGSLREVLTGAGLIDQPPRHTN
ncbi:MULTISPECIES: hypothetical protein [unclassified Deinococcus]|uniref:hypothetical protein n=1 Tax=unclassified Deinococcus TaxID=2623546 RepID=UPI001C30DFD0|nr:MULTISPECIES: hypothetical protein [unclassified Deinococcus]MDK2013552.1 hypothetical protein [Deinococcus sp. 43]